MTAPFIAEAERAAYEAIAATWHDPDDGMLGLAQEQAAAAVAAVVPILAEHFAQAVEAEAALLDALTITHQDRTAITVLQIKREQAIADARVIREAATPTEGGGHDVSANPCARCGHNQGDNPPSTHCGHCLPWTCPTCGQIDSMAAPCGCWVTFDGLPLADIKGHLAALDLSVETP